MELKIKDFKTWLSENENENENEESKGTYVAVKVQNESELHNFFFDECEGKEILSELTPEGELHSTIAYSRVDISDCFEVSEEEITVSPENIVGYRVFGEYLVLELNSPELTSRHEYANECGATYDYDEYIPHITIGKLIDTNTDIDVDDMLDELKVPDFTIVLGNEYMEELDLSK